MELATPAAPRSPWIGAGISAGLALLVLIGAALAMFQPEFLTRWFGPPAVTMAGAYEEHHDGPGIDHSPAVEHRRQRETRSCHRVARQALLCSKKCTNLGFDSQHTKTYNCTYENGCRYKHVLGGSAE